VGGGTITVSHKGKPNDHKPNWVDFFRSLPGKPDTILSDRDPRLTMPSLRCGRT